LRESIELAALENALELAPFVYTDVPGLISELRIEGVRGYETSISHPNANLVGCARLEDASARLTVAAIRDRFAHANKAFGWLTSPLSRPPALAPILAEEGLVKVEVLSGMALTDLNPQVAVTRGVTVRPASPAEIRGASHMIAIGNGFPADIAAWFGELWISAPERVRCTIYLAYTSDHDGPVAYGGLLFIPDTSIVLLGGAATIPEARGRGVYRSLVARRLLDARNAGAQAAVILAVRGTSAPSCARLGFTEILPLEYFVWLPPGLESDQLV